MHADEHGSLNELTECVLGAVIEVSNTLGAGFLEKVYRRALCAELSLRGLGVEAEVGFDVRYKGSLVGQYFADLVVEKALLVELKCVDRLDNQHLAQCLNYLKAAALPLCLLVNLQRPKAEWKRVVLTARA